MELGVIEVVVNRKKNGLMSVLRILCIIGAVVFLLLGMTLIGFTVVLAVILIAIGIVCVIGAYIAHLNSDVDYEYSLVDHELRVAKIMNKERRKHVGTYDLDKMEIFAISSSHQLDSYHNMRDVSVLDYSSKDETKADSLYEIYLFDAENKLRILLNLEGEEGQKLITSVRQFAPRKVFIS